MVTANKHAKGTFSRNSSQISDSPVFFRRQLTAKITGTPVFSRKPPRTQPKLNSRNTQKRLYFALLAIILYFFLAFRRISFYLYNMQFTKTIENQPLTPLFIEPLLQKRLAEINTLLATKLKEVKKAPAGSLRVTSSNRVTQYYHKTLAGDTCGRYIPAKNLRLAKALAQKDYDLQLIEALKKESRLLQAALNSYKKTRLAEGLFSLLHKNRQPLVTPVFLPDSDFAKLWQSITYEKKPFAQEAPVLLTARNERVRSKSEIIIADTLNRLNIPYRYEFPINLKTENGNYRLFHPDFICLNLRTRTEFLWEHFGMMDDPEYSAAATRKLRLYESNSIYPGKNLILSTETSELPINTRQIEKLAMQYLK